MACVDVEAEIFDNDVLIDELNSRGFTVIKDLTIEGLSEIPELKKLIHDKLFWDFLIQNLKEYGDFEGFEEYKNLFYK